MFVDAISSATSSFYIMNLSYSVVSHDLGILFHTRGRFVLTMLSVLMPLLCLVVNIRLWAMGDNLKPPTLKT